VANEHFLPAVEPYDTGTLAVDEPHLLYWEQVGQPDGEPMLFLHGGPGAGSTETDRRFFDGDHFRVVLFDQRGCGRSTPIGETTANTIDDLVRDIERLRQELGIDTWHVFGGSWGSTLALYYAQAHPAVVRSLILRGIWMMRDEEIDWWLYKVRFIYPETWREFAEHIPAEERGDLLGAYRRRLGSTDRTTAMAAARAWSVYEGSCCTLLPNPEFTEHFEDEDVAWAVAQLEAHYFATASLGDRLLDGVDAIRHIPTHVVHGRYDIICPVKNALDLQAAWPEATYEVVPDAGHSSHEPGITKALIAATNRVRDHGVP